MIKIDEIKSLYHEKERILFQIRNLESLFKVHNGQ